METKFYVGQRVRSNKFGEGVVVAILTDADDVYPVECDINGWKYTFTIDGQHNIIEPIDLFYIDPPRVVLTEWQRKQLREYVREEFKYTALFNFFDRLESILSEPEPPKYQPKQGESVIFRDRNDCPWSASVATGIYWRIYYYGDTLDAFEVRPFDASLIGQVTSD